MTLTSSAFENEQMIPKQYSRDGDDMSPPLMIQGVPKAAKSLAILVDDPDAPGRLFNHWILFNIAPNTVEIKEGECPLGAMQGKNDWGELNYGGPQPPSGVHRYFFKLYALDTALSLQQGASREQIYKAMHGHILEETNLMGRFPAPQMAHAR